MRAASNCELVDKIAQVDDCLSIASRPPSRISSPTNWPKARGTTDADSNSATATVQLYRALVGGRERQSECGIGLVHPIIRAGPICWERRHIVDVYSWLGFFGGGFVEVLFRPDRSHATSRFRGHGSRGAVVCISSMEPTSRSVIIPRTQRIYRFAGVELPWSDTNQCTLLRPWFSRWPPLLDWPLRWPF